MVHDTGLNHLNTTHLFIGWGRAGHLTRPNTFSIERSTDFSGSGSQSLKSTFPLAPRTAALDSGPFCAGLDISRPAPLENRGRTPEHCHEAGFRGGHMASSEAIVFAGKGNFFRQLNRFWVTMADARSPRPARKEAAYGPRVMPRARSPFLGGSGRFDRFPYTST